MNTLKTTTKDNVITVQPRRRRITHQGLHGWVEYKPKEKIDFYSDLPPIVHRTNVEDKNKTFIQTIKSSIKAQEKINIEISELE